MLAAGLVTAVLTGGLDEGALMLDRAPGQIASIWPSNAVVVVLMLARRGRGPWAVWIAGVVGQVVASLVFGDSLLVGGSLSACNGMGVAMVYAAARAPRMLDVQRPVHMVWFLGSSALAAILTALPAAMVLHLLWSADPQAAWVRWALADGLGYAALGPPLLILMKQPQAAPVWRRRTVAVLTGYAFLLALLVLQTRYPLLFVIPMLLFAVAYLVEMEAVMVAILITIVMAVGASMAGRNPANLVLAPPDQRMIWLQIFLVCITFASLPISAVMGERRRLQEALVKARADAEAASALKSEFLADISHELRTPLACVLGLAGMLRDNHALRPEDRDRADSITVAGGALLTTVNDILAFSEMESRTLDIRLEAASVGEIASETLGLFQAAARIKGLGLTLVIAKTVPAALMIDRARLRQVMLNLLGNAVKFTATGGVAVSVDYDTTGQTLTVKVEDTGPGVEPAQVPYLFDRFSRADDGMRRRHGGTGLGLAICKGLVEAMGGAIDVRSVAGLGAAMTVRIPAAPAPKVHIDPIA
jgi:signal transduction histidine kinase